MTEPLLTAAEVAALLSVRRILGKRGNPETVVSPTSGSVATGATARPTSSAGWEGRPSRDDLPFTRG